MNEKTIKIMKLLIEVDNHLIDLFFDLDSDELLDEKIEVLTALKDGVVPADIPNFYKVLELMPDDDTLWD